jgi:hypothetical protein
MSNNPIPLRCPNPADLLARPAWSYDVQAQFETENVGNSQEAPAISSAAIARANVGKRKTPDDLLELIPSAAPIAQAKLFEAARLAGINEKYARQFLSSLIADKRVLVQKIPRQKAKSALGYIRASLTASPAFPNVMIADR